MKHDWDLKKLRNAIHYYECRRCGQTVSENIPRTGEQLYQAINSKCITLAPVINIRSRSRAAVRG
jgi:translation initiation factor 2 beta subunit (eIF-2beta)/eIF-5